jgi:DNA-binding protein YbaB
VAVTTNHREEVAQLLADYRRSREQLASVHSTLLSISESASSPDGLITASVDSAGTLTGLRVADEAYQRYRPAELADVVVRTTRSAAVRAAERARQALAPVLPPGGDPEAVLSGRGDLRPDEIDAPTPPTGLPVQSAPAPVPAPAPVAVVRPVSSRPPAEDDETYEETTWMNRSGRG